MTRYIRREQLEHAIWTPGTPVPTSKPEPAPQHREKTEGRYILMPRATTYAQGFHALRNACQADENSVHPLFTLDGGSEIYRPLTFKENIGARVIDFYNFQNPDGTERTKQERLRLFTERWLDSCTAIAYQKGTTKFKVVPMSPELITIPESFNQHYMKIEYASLGGTELDRAGATYNALLTPSQVENHPAWLAAVEDDVNLLKAYRDIVFAAKENPEKAMGFWLRDDIPEDHLRALFVDKLGNNSNANGNYNLNSNGSFLHVAPVVSAAGARRA